MHKLLLDLPARLETPRLMLRPYQAGDGAMYFAVAERNRDHLIPYEAKNPLVSLHSEEEAEVCVRQMALDFAARERFFWGAFLRETGAWVAQVYCGPVEWERPEFEIGYIADVAHAGRGYVSEATRAVIAWAFGPLGAERLRLTCDANNLRSQRTAERCGFTLEGRLRRDHRWPDGRITDTLLYGLLREEES
jgi:RimJ/RimL family protein N-acetyltransferase